MAEGSSLSIFENQRKSVQTTVSDYLYGCELQEPDGILGNAVAFESISHGWVKVDFPSSDTLPAGNLCTTIPNIEVVTEADENKLCLTWEEARKLCAALWQVTNIAEFG